MQKASYDQVKVSEAPVVIIAFALRGDWKRYMDAIFREGARRGVGTAEGISKSEENAGHFLRSIPEAIWLNRHVMIAFTTLMLVAECYGLDTAPMEGFDAETVRREFGIPKANEVVALLAIGFAQEPDKAYGGRLALSDIVCEEEYGRPWGGGASEPEEVKADEPEPEGESVLAPEAEPVSK